MEPDAVPDLVSANVDEADLVSADVDEAGLVRPPTLSGSREPPLTKPTLTNHFEHVLRNAVQHCGLTYVRIERAALGDDGAVAISRSLAAGVGMDRLRALYLGHNGIGDKGAEALAQGLRDRPVAACRLKKLYLNGNARIGYSGCVRLRAVCRLRGIELIGLPQMPPPPKPPPRPRTPPPLPTPKVPSPSPSPPPARPLSPPPTRSVPIELLPCNKVSRQQKILSDAPQHHQRRRQHHRPPFRPQSTQPPSQPPPPPSLNEIAPPPQQQQQQSQQPQQPRPQQQPEYVQPTPQIDHGSDGQALMPQHREGLQPSALPQRLESEVRVRELNAWLDTHPGHVHPTGVGAVAPSSMRSMLGTRSTGTTGGGRMTGGQMAGGQMRGGSLYPRARARPSTSAHASSVTRIGLMPCARGKQSSRVPTPPLFKPDRTPGGRRCWEDSLRANIREGHPSLRGLEFYPNWATDWSTVARRPRAPAHRAAALATRLDAWSD